jgi:hypothetical protein
MAVQSDARRVSSKHFGFPFQLPLYSMLHTHLTPGTGTISQTVADELNGFSFTPTPGRKTNTLYRPDFDKRLPLTF